MTRKTTETDAWELVKVCTFIHSARIHEDAKVDAFTGEHSNSVFLAFRSPDAMGKTLDVAMTHEQACELHQKLGRAIRNG